MKSMLSLLLILATFSLSTPGIAAGDAANGAKLYAQRCSTCHAADAHGEGPAHRGVFGRRAGSAPGFGYSAALRRSGLVWNERTLDAWLADPDRLLPGQAMEAQVTNPKSREDLVAYLKTLTR